MSLADTIGFLVVLIVALLGIVAFVNEAFWRIRQRFIRLRAETRNMQKDLEPESMVSMGVLHRDFHLKRD